MNAALRWLAAQERVNILALTAAWGGLMAVVFLTRPLLPIDETRCLSVAWDMWVRGDQLVPHLNGAPYSHKPPLLFWLIEAGWLVFGVSETWARLVAPIFGLGCVLACQRLCRVIWPDSPSRALLAPWILIGCLFWTVFGTVTMFDILVAAMTMAAVAGLLLAVRGRAAAGWTVYGLALGLGLLAKGPVILVFVLPPALLAPWWASPSPSWGRWYGALAAAVGLGASIALAWALPAAASGGEAYGDAILWGQTAGRLAESFAHARAVWWYAAMLPLLLFPWVAWPRVWRGLTALWRTTDPGLRLCIAWAVPPFLLLSMISSKQPHYLIPVFPAFALAVAATLPANSRAARSLLVPGAGFAALGAVLGGLVLWIRVDPSSSLAALDLPGWGRGISLWLGVVVLAAGVAAAAARWRSLSASVTGLASLSLVLVVAIHVFAVGPVAFAYDLEPAARHLRESVRESRAVAVADEYHGQFHFVGRIREPFRVFPLEAAAVWAQMRVRARVVAVTEDAPPSWTGYEFIQPYRGRVLTIWNGDSLGAYLTFRAGADREAAGDGAAAP